MSIRRTFTHWTNSHSWDRCAGLWTGCTSWLFPCKVLNLALQNDVVVWTWCCVRSVACAWNEVVLVCIMIELTFPCISSSFTRATNMLIFSLSLVPWSDRILSALLMVVNCVVCCCPWFEWKAIVLKMVNPLGSLYNHIICIDNSSSENAHQLSACMCTDYTSLHCFTNCIIVTLVFVHFDIQAHAANKT